MSVKYLTCTIWSWR